MTELPIGWGLPARASYFNRSFRSCTRPAGLLSRAYSSCSRSPRVIADFMAFPGGKKGVQAWGPCGWSLVGGSLPGGARVPLVEEDVGDDRRPHRVRPPLLRFVAILQVPQQGPAD